MASPRAGPVSGLLWCQIVKELPRSRGDALGATPAHYAILWSLCGPLAGRRNTEWKEWKEWKVGLLNSEQLTMAEK